ncbi:MAG: IS1595 family transposase [Kiritimatiellae bacterium]|nr:IS1595 family transposase [Kiritimatiellia bacterium]
MAELDKRFDTREACLSYLAELRWPAGFICPHCASRKAWHMSNGLMLCSNCRYQQSILAGTIFQNTHIPLQTWFRAMWLLCANKNGMSAQNLQRLLGLRSYNTAWLCLHKLRRAMVRPGRERLSGIVEVDEAYLGGPQEGKRGRGEFGKELVFVAAEIRGKKIGRIRLRCIPDVSGNTLELSVTEEIQKGAVIKSDGWSGYSGIKSLGYGHEVAIKGDGELAAIVLPRCHLVVSLLKRWILGTLQGNVGKGHLQDYLNEFTFRFNRRSSKSRGLLFYRLAELAVATAPNPRSTIIPQHGPEDD